MNKGIGRVKVEAFVGEVTGVIAIISYILTEEGKLIELTRSWV